MTYEYDYDGDEETDGFDHDEGGASFDEDDLEDDDFDDDFEDNKNEKLSDDDVAQTAFMDGQMDSEYFGYPYPGYEATFDDDDLTDEQKELYETEYLAGYQDQENADELDVSDDDDF